MSERGESEREVGNQKDGTAQRDAAADKLTVIGFQISRLSSEEDRELCAAWVAGSNPAPNVRGGLRPDGGSLCLWDKTHRTEAKEGN